MELPRQVNKGLRSGFKGSMEVPSQVNKVLRSGLRVIEVLGHLRLREVRLSGAMEVPNQVKKVSGAAYRGHGVT